MKLFFVGILFFAADTFFAACPLSDCVLGTRISIQSDLRAITFKDAQTLCALNLVVSDIKPGEAYNFFYSSLRHYAELVGQQISNEDNHESFFQFKDQCGALQKGFDSEKITVGYRGVLLESFRDDFRNACSGKSKHMEWLKKHKGDSEVLAVFANMLLQYAQDDEGPIEDFLSYIDQKMSDR